MSWIEYLIVTLFAAGIAIYVHGYYISKADGRDYCVRPVYMRTTQDCGRIPTVEKPYCPFPN